MKRGVKREVNPKKKDHNQKQEVPKLTLESVQSLKSTPNVKCLMSINSEIDLDASSMPGMFKCAFRRVLRWFEAL